MTDEIQEYAYRPKFKTILIMLILGALGAIFASSKAVHNNRRLIIFRIIELDPSEASIFYWILAAFCAAIVLTSLALTYHRMTFHQRVVIGPQSIIVPASRWSHEEKEIEYRNIINLSRSEINKLLIIYIMHTGGKNHINADFMPSKAAYEECCELITSRVRASRESQHPNASDSTVE
ncbi:hypothetical protein KIH39_20790 [Telmatocola sphagniphila]|uniref:Uncharacterized protein n=1 Tax=Telmatocola sphagniphila TaxID=1123043 RepID=A0A8E6B4G4_9BACT|nr:hypothetical protein [Telmatocola sphagniphila]QVL31259.1 hypothetical protein KIH39_20790 [Telmatocola sphagniphila]